MSPDQVRPEDLDITMLSDGGGWLPKTTGVRVTHRPSGLSAVSTEERSQHRNREVAYQQLLKQLEGWEPTQGHDKE